MARKSEVSKVGPRSGRINPKATLNAQSAAQIYRIYNTGDVDCPIPSGSIGKGCSRDFSLNAGTSASLGAPDVEAVYELVPSPGLRSGRFNKSTDVKVIIGPLGVGSYYRIFNTKKAGAVAVTIGATPVVNIANGCSMDFFLAGGSSMAVAANDRGVYDFLAFDRPNALVDPVVRSGHFKGNQKIASLTGSALSTVFRIINSGSRDIGYTGMPASQPIKPDSSCDVEVPASGTLDLTAVGAGTAEIQGSYELLKIN